MPRIRITQKGWAGFTGSLGTATFKDGEADVSELEAFRLGASIEITRLNAEGVEVDQISPSLEILRTKNLSAEVVPAMETQEETDNRATTEMTLITPTDAAEKIDVGLEPIAEKIAATAPPAPTPEPTPAVEVTTEAPVVTAAEVAPEVAPEVVPEVVPEVTAEVAPEVTVEVTPEVAAETVPEVTVEAAAEAAVEVAPEVTIEVEPSVAAEEVEVDLADLDDIEAELAEAEPAAAKVYTREELEAIADTTGIKGLREIADPMGLTSTSIVPLIDAILETQNS